MSFGFLPFKPNKKKKKKTSDKEKTIGKQCLSLNHYTS